MLGATPPTSTKRPGIITLLGVLQLIGAAIELLIAVALIATAYRNAPESAYFASAEPVTPGTTGTRYFATDTRGIISTSDTPIANPIAPGVMPLQ